NRRSLHVATPALATLKPALRNSTAECGWRRKQGSTASASTSQQRCTAIVINAIDEHFRLIPRISSKEKRSGFNLTRCGLFSRIGAYASGRAEVLKTELAPSKTIHKSVLGALKRARL